MKFQVFKQIGDDHSVALNIEADENDVEPGQLETEWLDYDQAQILALNLIRAAKELCPDTSPLKEILK